MSVGDYVTKGMKVAIVVRVNPLRVAADGARAVRVGGRRRPAGHVRGRRLSRPARSTGTVRYVSPALEADQRALTVEAVVPNPNGELKPGLFATARIEQPTQTPAIARAGRAPCRRPAAPAACSSSTATTSKSASSRSARRSATLVEITNGLKAGERVATTNVAQLADGVEASVS